MTAPMLNDLDEETLSKELPSSVRETIRQFENQGADWESVGESLAMMPTSGVSMKGGGNWRADLWAGVKSEFAEFLCSDSEKYQDLRDEWKTLKDRSSHVTVASLSATIGANMGIAAGVIAPLVVWLLIVGLRMGKEGVCKVLTQSAR